MFELDTVHLCACSLRERRVGDSVFVARWVGATQKRSL